MDASPSYFTYIASQIILCWEIKIGFKKKRGETLLAAHKLFAWGKRKAVTVCFKAADAALFLRFVRQKNRLSFHGTLNWRENALTSAGCKGAQLICYNPFAEQKEELLCSMWNIVYALLMQIKDRCYWSFLEKEKSNKQLHIFHLGWILECFAKGCSPRRHQSIAWGKNESWVF